MSSLNLGILAHVDAGKTSLTERLLHAAGVIDEVGSVDDGSTQTDSLALERQRGITIKSAVVSFVVDDVTVNLIDTPGHPDFIAEVERVLSVLDGAVLVVSAVEGVQAQTRVLMRTLRRLRIPTLIFVNKVDRSGADPDRVLSGIAAKLTPAVVAMNSVRGAGTRTPEVVPAAADDPKLTERLTELLADHDDALLAAYVEDETIPDRSLHRELARQVGRAVIHPVYFGSAATGAGVDLLTVGIRELLPSATGDADGPVSGLAFKVERGPAGEKIAYVRMLSGTLRVREPVEFGPLGSGRAAAGPISRGAGDPSGDSGPGDSVPGDLGQGDSVPGDSGPGDLGRDDSSPGDLGPGIEGKVTAIGVFEQGSVERRSSVAAGRIAKVWGLGEIRIGDRLGGSPTSTEQHHFAPPTLETVVVPRRPRDRGALHVALTQLAEQDPLINLRHDELRHETSVSLYGEVQKEVIQATLSTDYGIDVTFRETTTICIERPAGTGTAVEVIKVEPNPFLATVGLRIEPAPIGSGVRFRLGIEPGSLPLAFRKAIEETVHATLQQGLHGWQVTDCTVTLIQSGYWARQSHSHGVFDKSMSSTAGDFRNLTPLVLTTALREAGTTVLEPMHRFHLEFPAELYGQLMPALIRLGALPQTTTTQGSSSLLVGDIPAARVHELEQHLPGLTSGEGVLESAFDHYEPVRGPVPTRSRSDHNPLNRKEYLLHVARRVPGG